MPLLNSLATPYAEALLQVTEARGESETVADQCKQLLAIWNDSEDFRDAMVSPVLEPDAKKQALKALAELPARLDANAQAKLIDSTINNLENA